MFRPIFDRVRAWWDGGRRQPVKMPPPSLAVQHDKTQEGRTRPKWKKRLCQRGHTNPPRISKLMRTLRAFHRVTGYTDTHLSGGTMPDRRGHLVATQPPVHPLAVALMNGRRAYTGMKPRRERRMARRFVGAVTPS